jgi:hypothetical protein
VFSACQLKGRWKLGIRPRSSVYIRCLCTVASSRLEKRRRVFLLIPGVERMPSRISVADPRCSGRYTGYSKSWTWTMDTKRKIFSEWWGDLGFKCQWIITVPFFWNIWCFHLSWKS